MIDGYVTSKDTLDVEVRFVVLAIKSLLIEFHPKRVNHRIDRSPSSEIFQPIQNDFRQTRRGIEIEKQPAKSGDPELTC